MKKPKKEEILGPWLPAAYTIPEVAAIQALMRGEATPEQQTRALKWIVEQAASTYDSTYWPDSESDRNYAQGKRHVGLNIVKMTKLDLGVLKKREDDAQFRAQKSKEKENG